MSEEPKFDECEDCRFFNPLRAHRNCKSCTAGEFFQERIEDREPTDTELMKLFSQMRFDDDQD